jgi:hypothetical protein
MRQARRDDFILGISVDSYYYTMNQPKPRQIRLPFEVPKPGRSKGQSRTCGM